MGEPARETLLATDATKLVQVPIAEIIVGTRARQDPGSLDELKASIEHLGLLHPIVVRPDRRLLCGRRRLLAFQELGRDHIPATIVTNLSDVQRALEAEGQENSCRMPLNPCEAVELGRRFEALEREPADQRMKKNRGRQPSDKLPEGSRGRVREIVGRMVGLSGSTYEHAKAVMRAAEKNRTVYGYLVVQMQATGNVDRAYRELRRRQTEGPGRLPDGHQKSPLVTLVDRVIAELSKSCLTFDGRRGRVLAKKLRDWVVAQERNQGRAGGGGKKG
jgi:ParB family chromosome partitioning protein